MAFVASVGIFLIIINNKKLNLPSYDAFSKLPYYRSSEVYNAMTDIIHIKDVEITFLIYFWLFMSLGSFSVIIYLYIISDRYNLFKENNSYLTSAFAD